MVGTKGNSGKSPIEVQFTATFALPFVLRLSDELYSCKYGRHEFMIATTWVEETLGEKQESEQSDADAEGKEQHGTSMFHMMTGKLASATGVHVPGAMLRYTLVRVSFFRRLSGPDITQLDNLSTRDLVHKFINHFLDLYRFIADDDTIRPLSRTELHQVRAGQAFHLKSHHVADGHGLMIPMVMFDEADPISVGGSRTLAEDKLADFRDKLLASKKPLLSHLLLLNARGYIRSGESRLAVIDMNTALDIVVESKAVEVLGAEGTKAEDAQAELETRTTSWIVRNILLPRIPQEYRPEKDWEEWYSSHRTLRNKVIHDGYVPTEEEAKISLANLGRLCGFFLSLSTSPGAK
jgi:hypothetical protein